MMTQSQVEISVVGTMGLPAKYGGFETLAENLVHNRGESEFHVYCSSRHFADQPSSWHGAYLVYMPFDSNGIQSIIYDALSIFHAVLVRRSSNLLVLGVSGAICLPLIRLISNTRIVTNIDGLEWRRDKWNIVARKFLKFSEHLAVRYSHEIIADNKAIKEYVNKEYGKPSTVIAYGGDHVLSTEPTPSEKIKLPDNYFFSVCRIEKENNIHTILKSFSQSERADLVLVGNWLNSDYGRTLRDSYKHHSNLHLLDPIYDIGVLRWLRESASGFVHGHSAGGTNPSLVEAMWFCKPIIAFDCSYNRATTKENAVYFKSTVELSRILEQQVQLISSDMGAKLLAIAKKEYTWRNIADRYTEVLLEPEQTA